MDNTSISYSLSSLNPFFKSTSFWVWCGKIRHSGGHMWLITVQNIKCICSLITLTVCSVSTTFILIFYMIWHQLRISITKLTHDIELCLYWNDSNSRFIFQLIFISYKVMSFFINIYYELSQETFQVKVSAPGWAQHVFLMRLYVWSFTHSFKSDWTSCNGRFGWTVVCFHDTWPLPLHVLQGRKQMLMIICNTVIFVEVPEY